MYTPWNLKGAPHTDPGHAGTQSVLKNCLAGIPQGLGPRRPALQGLRSPQGAPGRRGTSGLVFSCLLPWPASFPPFRGETRPGHWNWEKAT